MAITKDIKNEYQATFKYHKISDVSILNVDGRTQLRITVKSYVDKEARKNEARAVITENIIENADFAMTPFYALLKAKFPVFNGTDDFDDEWKNKDESHARFTQQSPDGSLIAQWEEVPEEEAAEIPEENTEADTEEVTEKVIEEETQEEIPEEESEE